jgi:hypothetical protein
MNGVLGSTVLRFRYRLYIFQRRLDGENQGRGILHRNHAFDHRSAYWPMQLWKKSSDSMAFWAQ